MSDTKIVPWALTATPLGLLKVKPMLIGKLAPVVGLTASTVPFTKSVTIRSPAGIWPAFATPMTAHATNSPKPATIAEGRRIRYSSSIERNPDAHTEPRVLVPLVRALILLDCAWACQQKIAFVNKEPHADAGLPSYDRDAGVEG